jgi:hypothetical protein
MLISKQRGVIEKNVDIPLFKSKRSLRQAVFAGDQEKHVSF